MASVPVFPAAVHATMRGQQINKINCIKQDINAGAKASLESIAQPALHPNITFIKPPRPAASPNFIAALLGFEKISHFYCFLDRDGKQNSTVPWLMHISQGFHSKTVILTSMIVSKLAYQLRRIFLRKDEKGKTVGLPKFNAIMEGGKMVPKTNDSILETLQQTVGSVCCEETDGRPVVREKEHKYPSDHPMAGRVKPINPEQSLFVLMFRLITLYPSRFQDSFLDSKHSVLGIHPNAWSAAYLVLHYLRLRRSMKPPSHSNRNTKATTASADCYTLGYFSDDKKADIYEFNEVEVIDKRKEQNMLHEQKFMDAYPGIFNTDGVDDFANLLDPDAVLNAFRSLDPAKVNALFSGGKLHDPGNILNNLLSDSLAEMIAKSGGFDSGETSDSQVSAIPPMDSESSKWLMRKCFEWANIQFDGEVQVPPELVNAVRERLDIAGQVSMAEKDGETEEALRMYVNESEAQKEENRRGIEAIDRLHVAQEVHGGFLPDISLEDGMEALNMVGLDVHDLRSPHAVKEAPPAKPHQVVGK